MPYEPGNYPPTPAQRSRAFMLVPLGLVAALVATAMHMFTPEREILGPIIGVAVWGPLAGIYSANKRSDEFFDALCVVGMRFLTGFVGIYLFLAWALAGTKIFPHSAVLFGDGLTFALLANLSFYAGYMYAWLRDRFS